MAADFSGAEGWLPDRVSIRALASAARGCQGCDLYADATQTVFGAGRARADVLLVGEQPGDIEDRQGKPFVGPAGRLLHRALNESQLSAETLYLTNAVKHFRWRPAADSARRLHQRPTVAQIRACNPWLRAELKAVAPKVVVLLGAVAGEAVFGNHFTIAEARGRPLEYPQSLVIANRRPPLLYVSIHPSAVLRADDRDAALAGLVADLKQARAGLHS
jgi:DNA polymerase